MGPLPSSLGAIAAVVVFALAPSTAGAREPRIRRKSHAPPAEMAGVVYHGPRDRKRIALTFDACSLRENDRIDKGVLETLLKTKTPATLFLGGKWMADMPEAVASLAKNPAFELASHGFLHLHLTQLTDEVLEDEVERSQAQFEKQLGHKATYIRAPYGDLNPRVVALLAKDGLTPIEFDLPSGDPDPNFTKKVLVKWVVSHSEPGSIVVMHINGNGKHTAEALPDIIDGLHQRGFELVRLSDLLARSEVSPATPAPSLAPAP